MPNKEGSSERHRMVVEEIEIPQKTVETQEDAEPVVEAKPDILDEGVKVSSQDFIEKENSEPRQINETPPRPQKEASPVFWILIPGIFILGAILGGIFFYQKSVNSPDVTESPTPSASTTPVAIATASPSANVDVSKFDVAVLNGSGIAGEAGKVKEILTTAGFNVTSTGNAATYDFTKTIIKAKSTVGAPVLQKLKDALSKSYIVGDDQTLTTTATVDIQIIVGSSKAE
jgi:hypothetical protein